MEFVLFLIAIPALILLLFLMSINSKLSSILDSNKKLVQPEEFKKMLDLFDVDVVVIEFRGKNKRRVAFIYAGWKFTSYITNDFEFPERITLID